MASHSSDVRAFYFGTFALYRSPRDAERFEYNNEFTIEISVDASMSGTHAACGVACGVAAKSSAIAKFDKPRSATLQG
jgi:hypothetical protein